MHKESKRKLSPYQLLAAFSQKICTRDILPSVIQQIGRHRVAAAHKVIPITRGGDDIDYFEQFRELCNLLSNGLAEFHAGILLVTTTDTMTREEAFQDLEDRSEVLLETVRQIVPQIQDAFNKKEDELPSGSPSNASMASMIFRQIEKKMEALNAAAVSAEASIWNDSRREQKE